MSIAAIQDEQTKANCIIDFKIPEKSCSPVRWRTAIIAKREVKRKLCKNKIKISANKKGIAAKIKNYTQKK